MRAVLWDMDGTIADTEELHFHAWQETLGAYGIEYDYATFIADFGRNNGEILTRILGDDGGPDRVAEVAHRKEAHFRNLLPHHSVPLLAGVPHWLNALKQARVRQVVSSSGTMSNIAAVITKLEIGDYFMGLMSGYQLPRGKPHPAIFLNSAAALAVSPADCIVIEDSMSGIEAARRAGMACIAVGKVIENPALLRLLDQVHGQPCLTFTSLEDVTWTDFERLWDAPHSVDAAWKQHPAPDSTDDLPAPEEL